jgi:hypothetical protein
MRVEGHDERRKATKRRESNTGANGSEKNTPDVLFIPKQTPPGEFVAFKRRVKRHPRQFQPTEIVEAFKQHYNLASASSMLSRYKSELQRHPDLDKEYLSQIKLSKVEQSKLRRDSERTRDSKGLPDGILRIEYVDIIFERARRWIKSPCIDDQIAGVFACTGFRPIEVLRTITISKKLQAPHPEKHANYYGCVGSFAKKGNNLGSEAKSEPDCRNKLFLAPTTDVMNAVKRIREAFPTQGLGGSNMKISDKYSKRINRILKEKYADLFKTHSPSAYTFCKLYAVASYNIVGRELGYSMNNWISAQLGHCLTGAQVLGYSNVHLSNFANHDLS